MNWNTVAGIISTIALLSPVLILLKGRLYQNGSLLVLLFYYLISAFNHILGLQLLPFGIDAIKTIGVITNYMDTPMLLIVLLFFCTERWKYRMIYSTLILFVLFAAVIAYNYGLQPQSSVYILGPGVSIILLYSIYFFVHFGKRSIVSGKNIGKTLMLVALLFAYGCYGIIYMLYYIQKTPAVADVFLILYLTNFITSVVMSIGLLSVCKRWKRLKEAQTTRKELALFFGY